MFVRGINVGVTDLKTVTDIRNFVGSFYIIIPYIIIIPYYVIYDLSTDLKIRPTQLHHFILLSLKSFVKLRSATFQNLRYEFPNLTKRARNRKLKKEECTMETLEVFRSIGVTLTEK